MDIKPNNTSSNVNKSRLRNITYCGILIACAAALQMLESPLPRFLPWLKLGLANVITLYAIIRFSCGMGFIISIFRTCLAAIILGSFLSPIHQLSFVGAISSAIVMIFIYKFFPKASISVISIFGAITSNIAQLLLVQLLFASNIAFWFYLALIIWIGIPSGIIVGKIADELLRRI